MKINNQNSGKIGYKYFLILPMVLALYMNPNSIYATPSAAKINNQVNPKPIKLKAAQLVAFAGKYRNMDSYVTITPANGGLILKQLQGARATISFYATNLREFNTTYFGKPYWIMFSGMGKGKAPSFVTDEHDIWVRVK